jgi:hypothetical protein
VALLEKSIEGLAMFNVNNTFRDEMQSEHRLHARMGRGCNVRLCSSSVSFIF